MWFIKNKLRWRNIKKIKINTIGGWLIIEIKNRILKIRKSIRERRFIILIIKNIRIEIKIKRRIWIIRWIVNIIEIKSLKYNKNIKI